MQSNSALQVNFAYKEAGEQKQALVKVRMCPKHAIQLNYKQNKLLIKKRKRELQQEEDEHVKQLKQSQRGSGGARADEKSDDRLEHSADSRNPKQAAVKSEREGVDNLFEGLFD